MAGVTNPPPPPKKSRKGLIIGVRHAFPRGAAVFIVATKQVAAVGDRLTDASSVVPKTQPAAGAGGYRSCGARRVARRSRDHRVADKCPAKLACTDATRRDSAVGASSSTPPRNVGSRPIKRSARRAAVVSQEKLLCSYDA